MIWALILAAGESQRMGRPKMLLPFEGKTIIETVIDRALKADVDGVMVVMGAMRPDVERKVKPLRVKVVFNPGFKDGMLSSVQSGFKALPEETEAVVILLGDQPSIPSAVIDAVVGEYRKSRKSLVVPVYKGQRGHPLLIDTKYREEIQLLNPDIGLRELLHRHSQDVLELEVSDPSILQDLDEEKDYQKELKRKP